jgi:hypothetical protein
MNKNVINWSSVHWSSRAIDAPLHDVMQLAVQKSNQTLFVLHTQLSPAQRLRFLSIFLNVGLLPSVWVRSARRSESTTSQPVPSFHAGKVTSGTCIQIKSRRRSSKACPIQSVQSVTATFRMLPQHYWNMFTSVYIWYILRGIICVYLCVLYIATIPLHSRWDGRSWVEPFVWQSFYFLLFLASKSQSGAK